jgi:hypothetical protein
LHGRPCIQEDVEGREEEFEVVWTMCVQGKEECARRPLVIGVRPGVTTSTPSMSS